MPHVPGLLILVALAAATLVVLLTAMIVRGARRPPRRTAGWALARGVPCDPGDLGLAFEAWSLDRPGGAILPVWEITARGTGPTAVVVHGWGRSRIDELQRLDPWMDLVARLVLYDLRGHGDAAGAGGAGPGASDLGAGEADDLAALLDALGPGPFLLVGHSMGAVIAVEAAAADETGRIAGVVGYGVYADFHGSLRRRLRAAGYPTRPLTDLAMTWLRLTGLRHGDVAAAAARMTCPLLLAHGARDDIAPIADAERVVAAASSAELLRVEAAGHGDVRDVDPDGHDAVIARFVAGLSAS